MAEYRIVTNGIKFRIQKQAKSLILRRLKWVDVQTHTYASSYAAEFDTQTEAEEVLDHLRKEDIAKIRGYIPVGEEK